MKRVDRVDQHGFPIPPGFDDQPAAAEPRRKPLGRKGRWIIFALLAAVIGSLLIESPLSTTGRRWGAAWFCSRAQEKLDRNDLPGALSELDWAIWCLPVAELYQDRGRCRLAAKDFEGSLEDYTRAIELDQKDAHGYVGRSIVYQRMGDFPKAINDLNQAIKRSDPRDPVPLNDRAYFRAQAGIELKEALADIEKAIKLAGKDNPLFIDTRGWIYFRKGDFEAALKDLNQAIDLAVKQRDLELDYLAGHQRPRRMIIQRVREWEQNLAVMYHHRGEVYEKLGQAKQAATDIKRGDKLGYNPAEGIY